MESPSAPESPREAVEVGIALGSNLGDRSAQLDEAVRRLRALAGLRVERVSPWIETAPVGGPSGQPRYLNGCLVGRASLGARELLDELLAIERSLGRVREAGVRNAPRTIDLDLLYYGDRCIEEAGLIVPHPRLEERIFVLEPLARVAPGRRLTRSGRTVRERLAELRGASPGGRGAP